MKNSSEGIQPNKTILKLTVILFVLFCVQGCWIKPINLKKTDSVPAEIGFTVSNDRSIAMNWSYVRWESFYGDLRLPSAKFCFKNPEFIKNGSLNVLPKKTRAISINIEVINPENNSYYVVKRLQDEKHMHEEVISGWESGDRKYFVVSGPVLWGFEYLLSAYIVYNDANTSTLSKLFIDDLHYTIGNQ
jgi:hypothetical protein